MAKLPKKNDPNLLVGFETSDDAGIYRLNDEMALVTTADFITPPVDDPHLFGQIAAANSISDIYAMGGKPVTCLNLVGFPADKLDPEILHGIVEGALSKITESGAVLAGGHTTDGRGTEVWIVGHWNRASRKILAKRRCRTGGCIDLN